VNLALIRLYARAIKGKRARGAKPHKRGKNVSMIGAVALRGIIASVNVYGSNDAITFEAFMINKLVPQLWKGACVVLDNSTIYKGDEVRNAIEAAGAKLVFLSPYSPEFNPMENLWSKLKSILRSFGARTYKALDEASANCLCSNLQRQYS
jgi:transposase